MCNDPKTIIKYSNDIDDIYEKVDKYNPNKNLKILYVFDDMIDDIVTNKKLSLIVTELFMRDKKLIISLVFIIQYYFTLTKYFILLL